MASSSEKRCLYEVLGLSTDCSGDEIRSAYKRLALQRHPDKLVQSGLSVADATAAFQELSNAYEVLSDPRERAWYDSHRSQILFSNPTTSSSSSSVPNLFSFFSKSVFSGYSDSGKGFYKVFSDVFDKVYTNEVNFAKKLGLGLDAVKEAPVMGNLDSPYSQVKAFYDFWLGFVTVMDFCWVDEYDAMAGVNRKSRRVMEEENRKLRKKARREYNETVRGLAEFVKKRDKRVIDMMVKKGAEMEKKREQEREKRREMERERVERARAYEDPEWARIKEEDIENGLKEMEDDGDGDKKKRDVEEFYCVVCGKKFKSEKQWKNHEQSKKHKEKVAELRDSFRHEHEVEEEAEGKEEGLQDSLGGNLNENSGEHDQFEHGEDGVEELNEQFWDYIGIQGENVNGEVSTSDKEGFDDSGVNGMKGFGKSRGSDDEYSDLDAMSSGPKSRMNADSLHETKSVSSMAQVEDSDNADFMEYDNRKNKRRNQRAKRGKEKKFDAEAARSDYADVTSRAKENGKRGSSNIEDSSSHSLKEHDNVDKGDDSLERNLKISNQPAERKDAAKQVTKAKSKNTSKGRKQKAKANNSSNMCETCGEDFESRNKLHKHLGETGHASLKYS